MNWRVRILTWIPSFFSSFLSSFVRWLLSWSSVRLRDQRRPVRINERPRLARTPIRQNAVHRRAPVVQGSVRGCPLRHLSQPLLAKGQAPLGTLYLSARALTTRWRCKKDSQHTQHRKSPQLGTAVARRLVELLTGAGPRQKALSTFDFLTRCGSLRVRHGLVAFCQWPVFQRKAHPPQTCRTG